MRPTNRLFLFLLIILFLCTTVPVVHAAALGVTCDDSPQSGLIDESNTVDTYNIWLVTGQKLIIDVDAEKIGSTLDSYLEVTDSSGVTVGFSDSSTDVAEDAKTDESLDPYLKITAIADDTYTLAISAASDGGSAADEDSYTLLFECSDPSLPTPSEFTWPVVVPDLLGATGSNLGSLVNITPENVENSLPFPLGVGPIADIEYQFSTHKIFVAVNNFGNDDNSVSIIAIDPDSGAAIQTLSLVPEEGKVVPTVVALEAAENTLYGVQIDDPSSEQFSLVLVTFDDSDPTDPTATLTPVFSFGRQQVWSLAYHSVEKIIYGVASIASTSHLIKIHLEPELSVETKTIPIADKTGQQVDVVALDFSHENVLFGVDLSGNLHEINHTTGQAVSIGVPIDEVSSLTFVTEEAPQQDEDPPIKTICSSSFTNQAVASSESTNNRLRKFKLKRNRRNGAIGLFKFEGKAYEMLNLSVCLEEKEVAESEEASTSSWIEKLWTRWNWKPKNRVFVVIRDAIPGHEFRVKKKGVLTQDEPTLDITDVELPATGLYYIMVIRPFSHFHNFDYCLSLDSDGEAADNLVAAWPSDESEENGPATSAEEKKAEPQTDEGAVLATGTSNEVDGADDVISNVDEKEPVLMKSTAPSPTL